MSNGDTNATRLALWLVEDLSRKLGAGPPPGSDLAAAFQTVHAKRVADRNRVVSLLASTVRPEPAAIEALIRILIHPRDEPSIERWTQEELEDLLRELARTALLAQE